mmetsp:Transcript_15371/g.19261  ORF Transcript_15371/g.19261 Transcript_15371/m.19261 type:complete len:93 (+) Transcript_15371:47-325(+)
MVLLSRRKMKSFSQNLKALAFVSLLLDLSTSFSFFSKRSPFQTRRKQWKSLQMGDDSFALTVLGDLHLDPEDMDCHYAGREHIKRLTSFEKK